MDVANADDAQPTPTVVATMVDAQMADDRFCQRLQLLAPERKQSLEVEARAELSACALEALMQRQATMYVESQLKVNPVRSTGVTSADMAAMFEQFVQQQQETAPATSP